MWPFTRKRDPANSGRNLIAPPGEKGVVEDMTGSGTSPIVSISVGTTGQNRSTLYLERMSRLQCAQRVQSMVVYDCNQLSINDLRQHSNGVREKIITPQYLPFSEGFLRRVDQYLQHHGAIERDMENMTIEMMNQALKSGTEPQVFLEWIGYGGHAHLSNMMHGIATKPYPESMVLPVVCFPDDRSMHRNIRRRDIRGNDLWDLTVQCYQDRVGRPYPMILTDNRRDTDVIKMDEALVTALASVEACFRFTPSAGSLAETASEFKNEGCVWIVVETGVISVIDRRALPRRRQKQSDDAHRKAIGNMAQRIKQSIWEIAQPYNRFDKSAFFTPGPWDEEQGVYENEQRIYVVMPFMDRDVEDIRKDIEDQLNRESFKKHFPGTKVAYAPGNPQWDSRPDGWQYVHISKLMGLAQDPVPQSITSILNDEPVPDDQAHKYFYRRNGEEPTPPASDGTVINDQDPPAANGANANGAGHGDGPSETTDATAAEAEAETVIENETAPSA